MWTILLLAFSTWSPSWGQVINRAPHFIQGGDMARLAVSEGTPPDAPVYTLQGEDPEGSKLHYSISGEYFTVNRDSGVVVLRKALDREAQDLIEVIISITGNYVAFIGVPLHYYAGIPIDNRRYLGHWTALACWVPSLSGNVGAFY